MMIGPTLTLSLTLSNSNTTSSTVVVLIEDDETHQSTYCCETESLKQKSPSTLPIPCSLG